MFDTILGYHKGPETQIRTKSGSLRAQKVPGTGKYCIGKIQSIKLFLLGPLYEDYFQFRSWNLENSFPSCGLSHSKIFNSYDEYTSLPYGTSKNMSKWIQTLNFLSLTLKF